MNRGILTLDGSGGASVEEGDFYSNPDPLATAKLKQKEDWVNLDRRGNWLEYGDSIDGSERVEKRFVNTANGYIDIAPDTHEEPTPCATPQACPSPKYDFNGNMTFDPIGRVAGQAPDVLAWAGMGPGQEFEYDFENRVTKILRDTNNGPGRNPAGTLPELNPLMEFVYDALGRRVQTTEYVDAATWGGTLSSPRTTHHVYLGLETIQEYSCGPSWPCATVGLALVREFVWGDPERYPEVVAMITHNPDTQDQWTYHYLHDVLGSVIGLVNSAGTLVERYTYDPYGKVFIESWDPSANENQGAWEPTFEQTSGLPYSAYGNPWMWTGQRYDAATGSYAFRHRTFLPGWGRWGQRDPIGYAAGSVNLYEYVHSGPFAWLDPFGLDSVGVYDCGDMGHERGVAGRAAFKAADEDMDHVIAARSLREATEKMAELRKQGITIDQAYLFDHGASGSQEIGDDRIRPDDPDWKDFAEKVDTDGTIHLRGCNVGADCKYVGELADAGNRRVTAFEGTVSYWRIRWGPNHEGKGRLCEREPGKPEKETTDDAGCDKKKEDKKDKCKEKKKNPCGKDDKNITKADTPEAPEVQ